MNPNKTYCSGCYGYHWTQCPLMERVEEENDEEGTREKDGGVSL